jgi:hypothetical protein
MDVLLFDAWREKHDRLSAPPSAACPGSPERTTVGAAVPG